MAQPYRSLAITKLTFNFGLLLITCMLFYKVFYMPHIVSFKISGIHQQKLFFSVQSSKMMRYDNENETLKDKSACAGVRADLKMCLLESECCRSRQKTPRECLNLNDGTVPSECYVLRNTFFECKRSMLDARQRFRGRKGY